MSSMISKLTGSSELRTAMLALACLSLIGCAGPQVVRQTETVEVEVERIVAVDPELTRPTPPPDRELVLWIDAIVLMIEYRHRWESCEIRLSEIRGLADGLE